MKKLSVNVLMLDGDATGVLRIHSATHSIIAYKLPRARLEEYRDREDLAKSGVYFLFGDGKTYIGQAGARQNGASGIVARLQEHDKNPEKEFWTEALFFVTKEDTFGQTELNYLENAFYLRSKEAERFLVTNANNPASSNITEEKEAELEEYSWYAEQVLNYKELVKVRNVGRKRAQEILVALEAKGFYVEQLKKG